MKYFINNSNGDFHGEKYGCTVPRCLFHWITIPFCFRATTEFTIELINYYIIISAQTGGNIPNACMDDIINF